MNAIWIVVPVAALGLLAAWLARPFASALVTLRHDMFARSEFVPYDFSRPDLGYPIRMAEARRSFHSGLYARPPFDDDGIPVTDYGWTRQAGIPGGRHVNPARVALYAIEGCFLPYLESGEETLLSDFLHQADWLRDNQGRNGEYRYGFAHPAYGQQPGWVSAWAQGLAISALVRAHLLTGREDYARAAKAAFAPMLVRVEDGGVLSIDRDGTWLEEVPEVPPSHILNGFITAWYGVVDLCAVSSDPDVASLRDDCARTLARNVPRYAQETLRYELKRDTPVSAGYPRLQVEQLRSLAAMTGVGALDETAADWERRFVRPWRSRGPAAYARALWWALNYRLLQLRVREARTGGS